MNKNKKTINPQEKFANKVALINSKYHKRYLETGINLSKVKNKNMKVSEIKIGPLRHGKLPDGFIDRIIKYKNTLKEVETSSFEEVVSNFQRDLNPDIELEIWEAIAEFYQNTIIDFPNASLEDKKKLFGTIVMSTMG